MDPELGELFTPLAIGPVEVPNRFFTAAHSTNFFRSDPEGWNRWTVLSDRAADYYGERAKGGFGLIIVGQTQVHPQSGNSRPSSFAEQAVGAYRAIGEACHPHGTKVFVQLNQNGREKLHSGPDTWDPAWGPSSMLSTVPEARGEMCKEMDHDDIRSLIAGFVQAALNVQEAGLDGVEIHAAHPHLLGEWLIPAFNKRTDEYGGSLAKRLRIVIEIVDAVRSACGDDFAVGARINGAWTIPGGQTIEEGCEIAVQLEDTGQVDFINVSGWPGIGMPGSPFGGMVEWAAAVKDVVRSTPVFTIGRIVEPGHAARILAEGKADMVGMTRASIADPEIPNKTRAGRADDVRICVGAGQGCLSRNLAGEPLTCQQNPAVGLERIWGIGTLRSAPEKKHVLVVGGGPGGLEAAMVAAQRGHRVQLHERSDELGGQVRLIRRAPRRKEMWHIVDWRRRQLEQLGVEVALNSDVTPELVEAIGPDVVIVATGSTPRRAGWYPAAPELDQIPGGDAPHVFTVWDALEGRLAGHHHVVVIDGSGYYQTTDAVEHLLAEGHRVSTVSSSPTFAAATDYMDKPDLISVLRGKDIEMHLSAVVDRIGESTVDIRDVMSGELVTISDVDAVAVSLGNDVVDQLATSLTEIVGEVHKIGDCIAPRGIEHAVFAGHQVARQI